MVKKCAASIEIHPLVMQI